MNDRRYTREELEAMGAQPTPPAAPEPASPDVAAPEEPAPPVRSTLQAGEAFAKGVLASLHRTALGLKQSAVYLAASPEERAKVNEEIRQMEEHYKEALATPIGKVGEFAGVAGQLAVPGAVAPKIASTIPRAMALGAGFEATQPVTDIAGMPSGEGTAEFLGAKGLRAGAGAVLSGLGAGVGKILTRTGPPISPDRASIVNEAKRLGITLTPAQRTGDITLQQLQEGLLSRPGSAKVVAPVLEAQRARLDRAAAKAIGSKAPAPTEEVLSAQREIASKGYEPIASIDKMSRDTKYITDLEKFAAKQATKATGSTDAASAAMRLRKGSGKLTGSGFIEELQGVRDMSFAARQKGDVATSNQLRELSEIMEDYAERRVATLAKTGVVPADAVEQLRAARTESAKIHAVEKATEPVSGRVSSQKYLSQEFKRQKASSGRGSSPVAEGLREVGDIARVLKQTAPYIGSSGTAERMMGQQLAEAVGGPFAAIRAAGPMLKNYMAAQMYLKYGGKPGLFGSRLSPGQNMMVRRLLPPATIGAGEALTE